MSYKSDPNLYTLRGEIKNVSMDSKPTGGIQLTLWGEAAGLKVDGKDSISVHLSKVDAIKLAQEILYRVVNSLQTEVDNIIRLTNFW